MSSLALLSLVGLSSLVSIIRPAAADDIAVITPQGAQAGQTVVLKWDYSTESEVSGTTGDINPFEIQLRSCGDGGLGCENLSCGTTYRTLCEACMDQDGSYDILMPADVAAGDYVFSVTYMGTSGWDSAASTTSTSSGAEEVIGCSGSFSVEVGNSSSAATAAQGVPVLEATAIDQQLSPGQAFTAQWVYDDGEGERSGSFDVNLYSCANGACDDGRYARIERAVSSYLDVSGRSPRLGKTAVVVRLFVHVNALETPKRHCSCTGIPKAIYEYLVTGAIPLNPFSRQRVPSGASLYMFISRCYSITICITSSEIEHVCNSAPVSLL